MRGRTASDDLQAGAARHPDKPAVITEGRTLSYGELERAAGRIGAGLRELGVKPGDRVALVLPNSAAAVEAIYGVLRAGAAISPLNPTIKERKLPSLLEHSGAAAVLCDEARLETVQSAAARAGGVPVVADVDALAPSDPALLPPPLEVDLAAVMYTSGSTGGPKGVTVTHRNMTFVSDSIVEYLELAPEDRVLCALPLSFNYGLYQLLTCIRVGATLVLELGFTFPGRIVQLLEQEQITGFPAVPTMFQVLVSLSGLAERELPHLRFLTNAGAALPKTAVDAVRRTFPTARLYSMYGQTECTRACWLPPEQLDERPTSVGIPIPGTEAWIEDDEGRVVPPGEVGELMVRGAHVMQGYWNDERATAERLRRGRWPWDRVLATGDLFRQDEEGYLYFVGRRDDIIKSRGEKVAPREVEEVLHEAAGVREAAVVGVPDELLGQAVHAHVSPELGRELDPHELRRHCAERLEVHLVPERIVVHAALPRTANGKVDRKSLSAGGTAPRDASA